MEISFNSLMINKHLILDGGSLYISDHIITTVSGESGSGKTTLFKYLKKVLSKKYTISCMEQVPLLVDGLTVRQHIDLMKEMYHYEDVSVLTERLQLNDLLDKLPEELSGGEKKRLSFFLCILKKADIYLLDEPTASLNIEYTEIYSSIIKKIEKPVIIFTHDSELYGIGDEQYHIQDHRLHHIKGTTDTEEIEHGVYRNNSGKFEKYFAFVSKNRKWKDKLITGVVPLSVFVVLIFSSYSDMVYKAEQKSIHTLTSNELLVLDPAPSMVSEDYGAYLAPDIGEPVKKEKLDALMKLDHVQAVEWRFQFEEPDYSSAADITSEEFTGRESMFDSHENTYSFRIYDQEAQKYSTRMKDIQTVVTELTYLEEYKDLSEVDVDFGVKGTYICKNMSDLLVKNMELSSVEELKGLEIEYEISVPIYLTSGRCLAGAYGNEAQPVTAITTVHRTIRTPIAGVLKNASFGGWKAIGNDEYCVYYERGYLEDLLKKEGKRKERTLYILDEDTSEYYLNEIPEDSDSEVLYTWHDIPWEPTSYSVYVDGIENMMEVKNAIHEIGLDYVETSTDLVSFAGGIYAMNRYFIIASIILGIFVVIYTYAITKFNQTKEKHINRVFMKYGMTKKELISSRKEYHLNVLLKNTGYSFLMFFVCSILSSVLLHSPLYPTVLSTCVFAVLSVVTLYVIPVVMEKKL